MLRFFLEYCRLQNITYSNRLENIFCKFCGLEGHQPSDVELIALNEKRNKQNTNKMRWFISELPDIEQEEILNFLSRNKMQLLSFIFQTGTCKNKENHADLFILNNCDYTVSKNMSLCVLTYDELITTMFGIGDVKITKNGSLQLSKLVGLQMKGSGPKNSNSYHCLQFKDRGYKSFSDKLDKFSITYILNKSYNKYITNNQTQMSHTENNQECDEDVERKNNSDYASVPSSSNKTNKSKSIKALSLCSSAGVGETYLEQLNIQVVVANELIKDRAKVYTRCYPSCNMIVGSMQETSIKQQIIQTARDESVELILMTLPCQGFSKAGKMNISDIRNTLFIDAFDIAKELQPKYIVMENVPEFIDAYHMIQSDDDQQTKQLIRTTISNMMPNYIMKYDVLNAMQFNTPQNRKRAFLLLSRTDTPTWTFPDIVTMSPKTVIEAIGHLPSLESGENASSTHKYHIAPKHNDRHILWMKHTPPGQTAFDNAVHFPQKENGERIKGFRTTYKRINPHKPCTTITMANKSISSQNNVHFGRQKKDGTYSDARTLTVLELMILTGLPENWAVPEFCSDKCVRDILGECVPPYLLYHICKANPLVSIT